MEIYYDTEFLEDGKTIRPISIGMVNELGEEYYAVFNDPITIFDAQKNPWLEANVLNSLPMISKPGVNHKVLDFHHPDVKPKDQIAIEVRNFILKYPEPSLWAYFASYDHVLLAQLYGKMIHMPTGIPQRTNDIAQEMERAGYNPGRMPGTQVHNALSDAREVRWVREKVVTYELLKSMSPGR